MIVCQRCGKENQDHYKFCLGCGAEISGSEGDSVGMMKTMMADAGSEQNAAPNAPGSAPMGPPPGVGLPTPPVGSPLGAFQPQNAPVAHAPDHAPMAQPPMAQPPMAQPPMAQPPMAQPPMAQPAGHAPMGGGGAPAPAAAGPLKCMQCQADIPPNFKFCGVCGTPIPVAAPSTPPVAPATELRATMTLIRPDGNEGGTHNLQFGLNKLGRSHGEIFESDGYLSPTHAELNVVQQGSHTIRDLGSLNGVFVRMTKEEELHPGQIIRIGQELLRFDHIETPGLAEDGTEVMGSPNPGYWGRITVIIGDNVTGAAYPLIGDSITMGREHGDINFPDDGYVSGMHARLVARDDKVYLTDMGSSNGTFMKVESERQLPNNSYILLGQQLFRLTVQ